jgi:signal transduction histidine kinase
MIKVLLVEDNADDALALQRLFRATAPGEYDATLRGSIKDATLYVAAVNIDVMMLDLGLPDATGLDAVRHMLVAAPHIPVVVMTGHNDQHLAAEALRAGAQDYLVKGEFEPAIVLRALRYAIERKALQEQLLTERGTAHALAETARKLTEKAVELAVTSTELKRSNEELSLFAAMASHDLQEPLRMVASYTQLLGTRYKGRLDQDADDFIAFAIDGANRMKRLIKDLLDYSRLGTNGANLRMTYSEDALKDALTNLHGAIAESGAVVTHDAMPTVLADAAQLTRLFQNLVGNAIKYRGPEIPLIHISSAAAAGQWRFEVRDNGLGIEAQDFDSIFTIFQRLHGPGDHSGTGLGLAICKKIVEYHGGLIGVDSKLGEGSTFHFTLA